MITSEDSPSDCGCSSVGYLFSGTGVGTSIGSLKLLLTSRTSLKLKLDSTNCLVSKVAAFTNSSSTTV